MPVQMPVLPTRLRKLIGLFLLLVLLAGYSVLIMALAASTWIPVNGFAAFLFYLIAGLGWVFPAGVIIWWMQQNSSKDRSDISAP